MSVAHDPATPAKTVGWRSIAFPVEHGGWGFTFEPIILGLLVAPSPAAWELSVAALAVFLARRPLKLVATDLVRSRWLERSSVALWFALLYGAIGLAGLVGAVVTSSAAFWPPYALAAPLAGYAIYADAHTRGRTLTAELAGSIAMGSTVAAIALADGWDAAPAFGLWFVLAARALTSVVLVRGQIRRVHDRAVGEFSIYSVQLAAIAVVAIAALVDVVPWLSVVAIGGIGAIAYWSLSRPPVVAKVVGWTQIGVGLAVVLLTAIGHWLGV